MPFNKKIMIIASMLAVVIFSALTSMRADDDHPGFKNLKVLPKDIPHEALGHVMHEWSQSLGVHCNFCHAPGVDGKLDFASDAKPEKHMARDMFKMMTKINNKYFEGKKDSLNMVVGAIKCMTCHRGSPHPEDMKGMEMHGDHDHGPGQQPPAPAPGQAPAGLPSPASGK